MKALMISFGVGVAMSFAGACANEQELVDTDSFEDEGTAETPYTYGCWLNSSWSRQRAPKGWTAVYDSGPYGNRYTQAQVLPWSIHGYSSYNGPNNASARRVKGYNSLQGTTVSDWVGGTGEQDFFGGPYQHP